MIYDIIVSPPPTTGRLLGDAGYLCLGGRVRLLHLDPSSPPLSFTHYPSPDPDTPSLLLAPKSGQPGAHGAPRPAEDLGPGSQPGALEGEASRLSWGAEGRPAHLRASGSQGRMRAKGSRGLEEPRFEGD